MAKTIHIGNTGSDFTITTSDRTYVLDAGDVVSHAQILTDQLDDIDNIVLKVNGTVWDDAVGLMIGAANSSGNRIDIGKTGIIDARQEGIVAVGDQTRISNSGTIFVGNDGADSNGIHSTGNGARIVNDGYMKAEVGFVIDGDRNVVINTGMLAGYPGTVGVIFETEAGEKNLFRNTGSINGSVSVDGSDGNEKVVNSGQFSGGVDLGAGDDFLVTSRYIGGDVRMEEGNDKVVVKAKGAFASLDGGSGDDVFNLTAGNEIGTGTTISGGMDDDVYIVSHSDLLLRESAAGGDDTVKSTVSFTLANEFENLVLVGNKSTDAVGNAGANVISGNGGSNKLLGLAGMDILDGGRGNDTLQGGTNNDAFAFRVNCGKDLVTDFTDLSDVIDLSRYSGIDSFDDLAGRIKQKDTDTVITLLDGDKITLATFTATNLTNSDFEF